MALLSNDQWAGAPTVAEKLRYIELGADMGLGGNSQMLSTFAWVRQSLPSMKRLLSFGPP